ncbi:MAG TPA: hypothetical protein VFM05_08345, partial [Candidatus Saccharimonadales bacterium]|nr:hypothetical protein [Candidatus Saccharimonadales bacterium]
VLILYRDVTGNLPAVKVYSRGELQTAIYPLKEFSAARAMDIWAVTALPNGGIALSGVLDFGNGKTNLAILSYSKDGSLKKLWDMQVRHTTAMAADSEGNIYTFGQPVDIADDPNSSFMLLAKYSPAGQLLREFLPRSRFSSTAHVASIDPSKGQTRLSVWKNFLVAYVANAEQVLWFDKEGQLSKSVDLTPILNQLKIRFRGESTEVNQFYVKENGDYVLQIKVRSPRSTIASKSLRTLSVDIPTEGGAWSGTYRNSKGTLVGLTSEGQLLELLVEKGRPAILASYTQLR